MSCLQACINQSPRRSNIFCTIALSWLRLVFTLSPSSSSLLAKVWGESLLWVACALKRNMIIKYSPFVPRPLLCSVLHSGWKQRVIIKYSPFCPQHLSVSHCSRLVYIVQTIDSIIMSIMVCALHLPFPKVTSPDIFLGKLSLYCAKTDEIYRAHSH